MYCIPLLKKNKERKTNNYRSILHEVKNVYVYVYFVNIPNTESKLIRNSKYRNSVSKIDVNMY